MHRGGDNRTALIQSAQARKASTTIQYVLHGCTGLEHCQSPTKLNEHATLQRSLSASSLQCKGLVTNKCRHTVSAVHLKITKGCFYLHIAKLHKLRESFDFCGVSDLVRCDWQNVDHLPRLEPANLRPVGTFLYKKQVMTIHTQPCGFLT